MHSSACDNCNGNEYVTDYHTGDVFCFTCGAVLQQRLMVNTQSRDAAFDATGTAGGRRVQLSYYPVGQAIVNEVPQHAAPKSAPYQRRTYFNERLSQFAQREPRIDAEHVFVISAKYRELVSQRAITAYKLSDRDVRKILRLVDKEQRARNEWHRYAEKYGEKWLSIRDLLCCEESAGKDMPMDIVADTRALFAKLQVPFNATVRNCEKRQAFLHYNFVLRRLFDLQGFSDLFNADLPALKTPSKRRKLIIWWNEMMRFLNWPYINTDDEYFPDPFFNSNIRVVSNYEQRRQRAARSRRNEAVASAANIAAALDNAHTYAGVCDLEQLRQLSPDRPSTPTEDELFEQGMRDLLDAVLHNRGGADS